MRCISNSSQSQLHSFNLLHLHDSYIFAMVISLFFEFSQSDCCNYVFQNRTNVQLCLNKLSTEDDM